jgi:hypothetical protein
LADEIDARLQIEVPQLIEDEITVSRPTETDIELNRGQRFDYGSRLDGTRRAEGTTVTLSVPFKGDVGMFSVRPSAHTLNPPRGAISGKILRHTVSGITMIKQR